MVYLKYGKKTNNNNNNKMKIDFYIVLVFAEHYDPEEEDDDEKLIYPKSDEQRRRLGEAVKNILLFRSLDQVRLIFPPASSCFYFLLSIIIFPSFHPKGKDAIATSSICPFLSLSFFLSSLNNQLH